MSISDTRQAQRYASIAEVAAAECKLLTEDARKAPEYTDLARQYAEDAEVASAASIAAAQQSVNGANGASQSAIDAQGYANQASLSQQSAADSESAAASSESNAASSEANAAASAAAAEAAVTNTLRISDGPVSPLANAATRANKVLSCDASGNFQFTVPSSGSAADVLNQIAEPTGAGLMGTSSGGTVQQFIDSVPDLSQSTAAEGIGAEDTAGAASNIQQELNNRPTLSDLTSTSPGKGSSLIGVKLPGSSSTTRTGKDKFDEIPSIKDYGAACDGTTDDKSAYLALKTEYPTGEFYVPSDTLLGTRILPAGRHSITSRAYASIGTSGLVSNPTFSSNASGWVLASGWTYNATPDRISHLTAGASSATFPIALKALTSYVIRVNFLVTASGVVNLKLGSKNLFGSESPWQENGTTVNGCMIAPVNNPNGSGTENIRPVSTLEWTYSFRTDRTVDGVNPQGVVNFEISTAANGTFRGEITSAQVIELKNGLQTPLGIMSHDATNYLELHGPKISADGGYNVLGYGDDQCLQMINGDGGTSSEGAHNVAFGPKTGASLINGDENAMVGAMAAQWLTGSGNTSLGYSPLKFAIKAMEATSIGYKSGYSAAYTTGLTSVGFRASFFATNGNYVTAIGHRANERNINGSNITSLGAGAGFNDGGNNCTAIGYHSGSYLGAGDAFSYTGTTAVGSQSTVFGNNNTAIGYLSHVGNYTGGVTTAYTSGTAIGYNSSANQNGVAVGANSNAVGTYGVAIGESAVANASGGVSIGLQAGLNTTGTGNTFVGQGAGQYGSANTFSNTSCIGYQSVVTGANQVQLGNSATTTYVYGTVQNRSDARDKADVRDTELGIEFINGLRPVDGKWDLRDDYYEEVQEVVVDPVTHEETTLLVKRKIDRDGSKKRSRYHHWFIAQEVNELCSKLGVDFGGMQHQEVNGGDDVWTLGYDEFIPPIVKAVQQCWTRMDELENRLSDLESK
ncbi:hypothetical protein [Enterobacter mori]